MSYFAYQDVSADTVDAIGADVIGRLVVTDLDRQCPDTRQRPFGRWSSTPWAVEGEQGEPIHLVRVSVVWPEADG